MAQVALRGFAQFEAALRQAWQDGAPDALTALDRLGKVYLQFARTEPAYYSAMFEAGVPLSASPELRELGERAFAVLREAAEKLCARMPPRGRPPPLMVALHIWAMSHGIASLFGRGDAARRTLPMSPEELLEANVLVYLRGLGLTQRRCKPSGLIPPLTVKIGDVNVIYIHTRGTPCPSQQSSTSSESQPGSR